MKKTFILTILAAAALTGCDDFLLRTPKDKLTPETFFRDEAECRLYTNDFYTMLPEGASIYAEGADYIAGIDLASEVIGNRTVPATANSWNWEKLRDINFFIQHADQCEDITVRNEYLGVARFFRALFYLDKVMRYGDVPWVDKPLDAESEELYKGRDDRKVVMGHVLEDIDFAIDNLSATKDVFRVTKWTALALKSRIFLFEGTYRKYHGIDDWKTCLEESAKAADIFIRTSGYTIYSGGSQPYRDLFNFLESNQSEVILSRSYVATLGLVHDANGKYTSISMGKPGLMKDVVNMYLMSDGTRFTDKAGYKTMDFVTECTGRDPRLAQTIRTPGYTRTDGTTKLAPDLAAATTGYQITKYVGASKYDSYKSSENDLPIFRTAEVYLNYAEAKAELGTLTQTDLDVSVNKLRDRVNMPHLDMEAANANPDPYLLDPVTGYRNVTGANQGVILEIRRERTVELICEGFRYWDIMRWKEGKRFERPFYGMYFPGTGSYDLDGNGTVDFVIYEGEKPAVKDGVVYASLKELHLSDGNSGYITVHPDIERKWDEEKDYLYPVPTDDRVLTQGKITQNPGWDDGLDF